MKKFNLNGLCEAELRDLNREIVTRLKLYSQTRREVQLMAFKIGDRVEFETEQGIVDGTVVRINQKTASVDADDGRSWRVSPHFLRKVVGTSAQPNSTEQTNLFQLPSRP